MAIFATAGAKLFIGSAIPQKYSDFVVGDFQPHDHVSWVEIKPLENLGEFGDMASEVTFNDIAGTRTIKKKGTRNAGTMEAVVGQDFGDAGQQAAYNAANSPLDFAFRIDFNDAPGPSPATPSRRFFIGHVMSFREQLGEADNIIRAVIQIGINGNIVRVNAATNA